MSENAAYGDCVAALQQMVNESREMRALLMHTNTYVIYY